MIKTLTLGTVLTSALLLTACGGSSSSSSDSYSTLQDLEYKTLNLTVTQNTDVTKSFTTKMIFKDKYTDNGYLLETRSTANAYRLCTVNDEDEDYKYMCLTSYINKDKTKSADIFVFNISNSDQVSGNYAYSTTANTNALVNAVSSTSIAPGLITGEVTSNTSSSKISNKITIHKLSYSKNNSRTLTQQEASLATLVNSMKSSLPSK